MTGELMVILGPPAVGKMTVGRAVCARSDVRLFHNHHMTVTLRVDDAEHVAALALAGHPCLSLDTSGITAEDAAARILAWVDDN